PRARGTCARRPRIPLDAPVLLAALSRAAPRGRHRRGGPRSLGDDPPAPRVRPPPAARGRMERLTSAPGRSVARAEMNLLDDEGWLERLAAGASGLRLAPQTGRER